MKGDGSRKRDDSHDVLLKVLSSHLQALTVAKADPAMLNRYTALLRFLKSQPADFLSSREPQKEEEWYTQQPLLATRKFSEMSLDELERVATDDATSRRELENLATERFSVPKGSMRSFSNKEMLVEKLRVLIENERTHNTITQVARRPTER